MILCRANDIFSNRADEWGCVKVDDNTGGVSVVGLLTQHQAKITKLFRTRILSNRSKSTDHRIFSQ